MLKPLVAAVQASLVVGCVKPIIRAHEEPVPPAPVSCVITLTGDIAAVFGGQPLDISGQTVSKTVPESPADVYAAGGPAVPVSWTGWRAFAYKASDFTLSDTNVHGLHAISMDGGPVALSTLFANTTGQWGFYTTGFLFAIESGSFDDKCGIRINGDTGDAEIYVGSHVFTKEDWAALGGMFLGKSPAPVATLGNPFSGSPFTAGDTYSAQIYTAAADLADVGFPAGTLDWCGNLIS